jgi:hypothetical protein
MYRIKKYSYIQAKKLGVIIRPSKNQQKKIDVYNEKGIFLASIGDILYNDYPTYLELEEKGKLTPGTAEKKRKAYKARHIYKNVKNSPAYFANNILW